MLLVVIVVAAFSLSYSAALGWIRAQRREGMMAMRERLIIEDVWFRSSTLASIYFFNVGKVEAEIDRVQVNGSSYPISPSSLSIVPNQGGWMNVTYTTGFVSGTTYTFKVATEKGSSFETLATR